MDAIILGVGDFGACDKPGGAIKTYALGSCVALVLYDPRKKLAGMAHIALPDSNIRKERAAAKPGYFADTAIASLLSAMAKLRGRDTSRGLIAKLAGGANIMDAEGTFSIGSRNVEAVNALLMRLGLSPMAQDVGGQFSRTVNVDVDTGKVVLSSPGRENWEL